MVQKSKKEILLASRELKKKRKVKEERKKEQEENIKKKEKDLGLDSASEVEDVDVGTLTRKQRAARKKKMAEVTNLKKVKFTEDKEEVF